MKIRVTPSARAELFETVVRLRNRDRAEAARFVEDVATQINKAAQGPETTAEMGSPWRSARATKGHRLYLRDRTDGVWLIAVWPDPDARVE